LQIHLAPEHRLLLDAEYLGYGDIKPLANRVDPQRFTDQCFVPRLLTRSLPNPPVLDACLGGRNGPGFGWQSIPVYKIGYQFQRGRLSLRAGYSYGDNPVQRDQALSAITAPAITKQHATIGASWALTPRLSLGWAFIDAIENRISVPNVLSNATLQLQGSQLVQVNVAPDPRDQIFQIHLNVWQSQLGLTWTLE
jgi:long-chain fatty acid transport protein